MKSKVLLMALVMILFSSLVSAQTIGHAKIRNAKNLVWFGIDCSQMQCVGREGFTDPYDIATRIVNTWNTLILAESDKYNVPEIFMKNDFIYDMSSVNAQNKNVDPETLVTDDAPTKLSKEQVQSVVNNYSSEKYPQGLGLVFIVESLNKLTSSAKVAVTLFDIESKEIIQSIRYEGEAGGFGFRNYWARSFYNIMNQMKDDYKKWYKKNK